MYQLNEQSDVGRLHNFESQHGGESVQVKHQSIIVRCPEAKDVLLLPDGAYIKNFDWQPMLVHPNPDPLQNAKMRRAYAEEMYRRACEDYRSYAQWASSERSEHANEQVAAVKLARYKANIKLIALERQCERLERKQSGVTNIPGAPQWVNDMLLRQASCPPDTPPVATLTAVPGEAQQTMG
jgi:hypothetical protein